MDHSGSLTCKVHLGSLWKDVIRGIGGKLRSRLLEAVQQNSFSCITVEQREVSLATPLVSLIQQYCTSEYTNPRDKAYALLSLTSDSNGRDRLRVDYSLSIGEVY